LDREVAEPDRALAGATWQVESLYLSGDAVSSVPAGATASLTFEEDGTLLVDGGCNRGRGTWVVEGDTLQIGPVAMTRKFCDGAPGELEAHVVQVLSAESLTYSIDAATLTIMADEVGLGLRQPCPGQGRSGDRALAVAQVSGRAEGHRGCAGGRRRRCPPGPA